MKRGLIDIINIKRGDAQITKVMRGTTLIWQNSTYITNINLVNSTSNSIRLSWNSSPSFTHYSIRRNGVEIYREAETECIDHLLEPSTSYNYSVYGHNGITGVAEGTGDTFSFSTTAIYGTIYPETTAYMNQVGLPNDGTILHVGTPQAITGTEAWTGFNEVVHFLKTNTAWNKIQMWMPILGETSTQIGVDGINPATGFRLDLVGNWTIKPVGLKSGGVATDYGQFWDYSRGLYYRAMDLKADNDTTRGIGIAVTETATNSGVQVEVGFANLSSSRFFIGVNVGAYGGFIVPNNTAISGIAVPNSNGISSGFTFNSVLHKVKNGKVLQKRASAQGAITTNPGYGYIIPYGVLQENETRKYPTQKTLSSVFFSNAPTIIEGIAINQGIEMWENYLKRKTW